MSLLRPALAVTGSLVLITGLAYPLALTGAGRILFPRQAQGSLLYRDGRIVGSRLIGQHTEDPAYFWGRLSAAAFPTDAAHSSGSNLAPSNPALAAAAQGRIRALRLADPGNPLPVPVDLVTASASGLDPHITPAAADYQVRRVARARGLPEAEVRARVARATSGRLLGLFGEPRVDVLALNLSLGAPR
ncbi:potassium-transporting ATPase subunit KdpC [Mesoterricola silvestris]|uniref:Potassium-transporting ATPase KdpC subunit n=1 Tax=Mesoterricola silvestris TaxID=2927979 RepID=A0AA48GKI5_9BACT|nr:potassium-transporting ATPase subunit KdpC [Mesoterricola silvestris]BDU72894.1 potassium-transporting ATPase KdpC subunit [Mesoterricola silvestris]